MAFFQKKIVKFVPLANNMLEFTIVYNCVCVRVGCLLFVGAISSDAFHLSRFTILTIFALSLNTLLRYKSTPHTQMILLRNFHEKNKENLHSF